MKKHILILSIFMLLLQNGLLADNFKVSLEDFDFLEIRVSGNVEWKSGQPEGTIECSSPLYEELEIEQNGRKLIIQWKNNGRPEWKSGTDRLVIRLQSEYLKKVAISGSADLRFLSPNKIPDFDLIVSGSGDFSGELDCSGSARMSVSGSGNPSPSGKCHDLSVSISGSGDFRGGQLKAEKVKIAIAGSGDASIFASEELDASVSGSGDIRYAGDPKKVSKIVSGSGKISAQK